MTEGRPYRDYFDNEYLKGDALPEGGRTYTITGKARILLDDAHKLALELDTGDKWLANITNCAYMTRIFGTNIVADWVGHSITLAFDPSVKFGKDTVGGIRVIGSPELDQDLTFDFQENSRKKPRRVTLHRTADSPVVNEKADSSASGAADDTGAADAIAFEKGPES